MGKTPTILKIRSTLNQNSALPNYTPHVREPFFWKAGGRLYVGDGKTPVGDGIDNILDATLHPINTYVPYLHARRKVGEDGNALHNWLGNTYVDNLLVANGAVKLYCLTENYKDNARRHDAKDADGTSLVEYILTVSKDTKDESFVHIKGRLGVSETLTVAKATTLNSTLTVAGKTTIAGATTLNSTLAVAGKTALNSALDVCNVGTNGEQDYVLKVGTSNVTISKPTIINDSLSVRRLNCSGPAYFTGTDKSLYVQYLAEFEGGLTVKKGGLRVNEGGLTVTGDNSNTSLKNTTVDGTFEVTKNYIIFNNIRLYIADTVPDDNDIPDGSIGIGWGYSNG